MDVSVYWQKCKIMPSEVMSRSPDPVLEFLDSPNISETVEARNFMFGSEKMDGSE